MNYIWNLISVILFSVIVGSENSSIFSKVTYEILYKAGVDAYLENRWDDCVGLIEKSIEDFFYFRSVTIQCRKGCNGDQSENIFHSSPNVSEIWHLQTIVTNKALCLMKCQNLYFKNRPKTSKETDEEFEKKVPYNYLQLCYFKINEPEKAASCAYTFLIHNPGHEVMLTNLQYYMAIPNLDVVKIKYLEPKDYQCISFSAALTEIMDLFLRGAQLYTEGKYQESIEVMEVSLKEYLLAEDECRYLCEGSMPQLSNEELYISITNQMTYSLRCKLKCALKLAYLYGQKHDDLFVSHYHYLQFNYYKIRKLKETCESVASFLLFHPQDSTMLSNKNFYLKQAGVSEDWFMPREEALQYHKRLLRESNLLNAIEKSFSFGISEQASPKSPTPPPGLPDGNSYKRNVGKKRVKLSDANIQKWFNEGDIKTILNEKQLNGTLRVLFTNLATAEECAKLVDLAMEGGVHGDGYNGKESPHTEFEMFEGLTVARAATFSQRGILNSAAAQLFLNISEKARQAVEVYFNLDTELFFAYTHLVCRTALPDSPDARKDLSHPIHADNCVLTPGGKCLKEKPAYIWRDYSSIVYLNEEFDGGEFIFATNKEEIQATVKPKCGHMVAFSAGEENLHGVKAVRKGRRCALAMWYTLDSNHRERERDFAESVLENIRAKQILSSHTTVSESFEKATLFKFAGDVKQNIHTHTEL